METWQEVLRKNSIASLDTLASRFGAENFPELDRLRLAAENFEFRISPAMVDLIKSPDDPIWRQYVPSVQELEVHDGIVDSLNEDEDSPVPNITHRYPDRALFLVSPVCASYCRFCTRRRKVGDPEKIPMSQFESAFQYLESHTEIRDVIMSGGDPLLLNDRRLDAILSRLRSIKHIEIIRIGSRVPCHLPERITPELCATIKKYHPVWINTHFNHPDELTPAAVKGLGMLADAGIPLGCQTVLLRGVNDTPEVMMQLMHRLMLARVRPYYIYMADQVAGAEHFRTSVQTGIRIMESLRGWTSGLANPQFVIDTPGGGGKIPLLPEYVISMNEEEVVLRNYRGEQFVYRQPNEEEAIAAMGRRTDPDYLFKPTLQLKKSAKGTKRASKVPKRKLA
ncbi:MAG: KamA family radical SAM protein [Gemmatimonadales bacterium]|jgi:lysine 2,3-aminomutase|nr:MAG: KamA family radical SAM protein [Gemmatimonadales bacterium]